MNATARVPISTGDGKGGKVVVPKGTKGTIKGVSNSKKILESFPRIEHKLDGWYYICTFPSYVEDVLCDKSQIDLD